MNQLLRRVVAEHRLAIVTLALALLANAFVYLLVARPLRQRSAGAADRAVRAADSLRAADRDMTQAEAFAAGKTRADEELAAFYRKVLPSDMTAARRMTYASLPALADKAGVHYDARTTTVEGVEHGRRLERMAIRMVVDGDYDHLRQFVYAVETAPDFIIIDDVSLAAAKGDERLRLTINLSTYYRLSGNGS
jgi:Tfp pilus assembly protein PilO